MALENGTANAQLDYTGKRTNLILILLISYLRLGLVMVAENEIVVNKESVITTWIGDYQWLEIFEKCIKILFKLNLLIKI